MANLSFSKVATVGSTGLVTGRVYFETSTGLIKVATSATATDIFGGVRSASYSDETKILTIINQAGETITLDLSDVASADSVTVELAKKLNIGTSADASTVQSYYGLKKYTDEAKSSAISSANSYTDEKIGEIPAAIVYNVSTLFADSATITSELSSKIAAYGESSATDFPVMYAGTSIGNIKPTWIRTSAGVTNMMCIADNKIWYFEIQGTTVQRAELAIS